MVLHHAERMLQEQDAMRQELSLFQGGLSGRCASASCPSRASTSCRCSGFNDAYPKSACTSA